jgi:hypothetical protein
MNETAPIPEFVDDVSSRIFAAGLLLQSCRGLVTEPEASRRIGEAVAELDGALSRLRSAALEVITDATAAHERSQLLRDLDKRHGNADPATHPASRPHEEDRMPTKPATQPGTVDVAFTLPAEVQADDVALCGEFNDWSTDLIKLALDGDGTWRARVALEPSRAYRYCYLLDGQRWENAWDGDYAPNPYGGDDSVILVVE